MSIAMMNAVWSMDLDSGSKFVLLSLADQANDKGERLKDYYKEREERRNKP
ncbi:MAG: hypothetical protein VW907_08950 [Opitutae bacterium]